LIRVINTLDVAEFIHALRQALAWKLVYTGLRADRWAESTALPGTVDRGQTRSAKYRFGYPS
jgi:hypothetical protein